MPTRTSDERLRLTAAGIAAVVGASAIVSPRLLLRPFGIDPGEVTGPASLGWRLFGVRTLATGAAAAAGDPTARASILPIQVADQLVFASALRSGSVPARAASLAIATSGVIIAAELAARLLGDRSSAVAER